LPTLQLTVIVKQAAMEDEALPAFKALIDLAGTQRVNQRAA